MKNTCSIKTGINTAICCVLIATSVGCQQLDKLRGREKPATLTDKIIDGPYLGNLYEHGQVTGTLKLDFVQSGSDLNGTYDLVGISSGTIAGTFNNSTNDVEFTFHQLSPCNGTFTFDGIHEGYIAFTLLGNTGCVNIDGNGTVGNQKPTRFH